MAVGRRSGWCLAFLVACGSRVASTDSDPDTGATDDPSPESNDSGPMNDAPFPPSETVECGEGWDGTIGGGALSPLAYPRACNPRQQPDLVDGYLCCSTDPATADGALPSYSGKGIEGSPPLYAGDANAAGKWGMCVHTSDIPQDAGLVEPAAANCPIPCDPTWSEDDVATVCGGGRICCQTTELGAKDCVQQDGVWRPVSGADIGEQDVVPSTNWNNVAHDTHQDPNGAVCLEFAGGDASSDAFRECIQTLSVANRRGYCMALDPGQTCPGADPSYVDACEAMN